MHAATASGMDCVCVDKELFLENFDAHVGGGAFDGRKFGMRENER